MTHPNTNQTVMPEDLKQKIEEWAKGNLPIEGELAGTPRTTQSFKSTYPVVFYNDLLTLLEELDKEWAYGYDTKGSQVRNSIQGIIEREENEPS